MSDDDIFRVPDGCSLAKCRARLLRLGRDSFTVSSHWTCLTGSNSESLCGACFRFCSPLPSMSRQCLSFERTKKASRDVGNLIDCSQERVFVCLRRFVETADFSHELERSSSNFFRSDRRIEVE